MLAPWTLLSGDPSKDYFTMPIHHHETFVTLQYISLQLATMMSYERHGISNELQMDCFFDKLLRLTQNNNNNNNKTKNKPHSSALLVLWEGNQPVTGGFPHKWPLMWKAFPCHEIFSFWNITACNLHWMTNVQSRYGSTYIEFVTLG